jgi:hypothetical protein
MKKNQSKSHCREYFLNLQSQMMATIRRTAKRLSIRVTESDAVEVHCLKIVDYLTEQYCAAEAFVVEDSSSDEIGVVIYDRQDPPFLSTRAAHYMSRFAAHESHATQRGKTESEPIRSAVS